MRKQYKREDLAKGVRGKYYAAYSKGTNLVLLSPDVAAVFPTSEAVNEAVRGLVQVAKESGPQERAQEMMRAHAARAAWSVAQLGR